MINGKSTQMRKEMYNKYKKSSIFSSEQPKSNDNNVSSKVTSRKVEAKEFQPHFENISAKERYLRQYGYKDKMSHIESVCSNKPKEKVAKKEQNFKAEDIMCRDMYNGCDPKEYRMKRCKSMYLTRSTNDNKQPSTEINAKKRCIDSYRSNIFFVENKTKEATKENIDTNSTYNSTVTVNKKNNNNVRKPFKRSLMPTNADWKSFNTETAFRKRSQTLGPEEFKKATKSFKKNNFFEKENTYSDLHNQTSTKTKNNFSNIESVKYDIISGQQKQNDNNTHYRPIATQYDNQITESFEVDIPKNFSLTEKNTLKNYFVTKGIHLYKIEEKIDPLNSNHGKYTFNIRRNKDDPDYQAKIETIKNILNTKQMKLNFIEPQKTKLKPRPKTPGNALKRNIKPSVRKNQPKIQYDTNFKNKEWENNKRNKK